MRTKWKMPCVQKMPKCLRNVRNDLTIQTITDQNLFDYYLCLYVMRIVIRSPHLTRFLSSRKARINCYGWFLFFLLVFFFSSRSLDHFCQMRCSLVIHASPKQIRKQQTNNAKVLINTNAHVRRMPFFVVIMKQIQLHE